MHQSQRTRLERRWLTGVVREVGEAAEDLEDVEVEAFGVGVVGVVVVVVVEVSEQATRLGSDMGGCLCLLRLRLHWTSGSTRGHTWMGSGFIGVCGHENKGR